MSTDASLFYDGSQESILADAVDDYRARLSRGEQPSAEEQARRYPQVADALRRVLPALCVMDQDDEDAPGRELGDFQIHRELGRGGMGVVYEAEQLSLNRHVALKVLPFAAVMDPRQLQRFKNEAQAAAHLHHTHIVPVYSIGCERGVHYYAMQYIEGPTVAEMIEQLKSTAGKDMRGSSASALKAITKGKSTQTEGYCRSVARLGIQAAEALGHAHQQGVVHRDIKPANLIVDAGGHLWITDFGLASFTNNPGLTMTGDIVGTVRYMSPEQALAKRVPVDHRTDIYSLGITLYELLTLEGAFRGDDPHKVIQEIAFREPKSASSINKAVPNELETILIKTIAKDPSERYETAQELADDLERFLEDKPIQAKRPGVVKRAGKWARRHRSLVAAAAVVLLLATVGLATATTLIWREKELSAGAHRRAQASARLAIDALDRILFTQAANGRPALREGLSSDLLEEGLRFYLALASENPADLEVSRRAGEAQIRASLILAKLGRNVEAAEALAEGIATTRAVIRREPNDAKAYFVLGVALDEREQYGDAIAAYREAIRIDPDSAKTRNQLGIALKAQGKYDEAIAAYREAIRRTPDWAVLHSNLSLALKDQGKYDEAIAAGREAIRLDPELAIAHVSVGIALGEQGKHDEAEAAVREAIRLEPGLATSHYYLGISLGKQSRPGEAEAAIREAIRLEPGWANSHFSLGLSLSEQGKHDEAVAAYREAIRLLPGFFDAHANLGAELWRKGRLDEAIAACREAIRLQPDQPEPHCNLGLALRKKGRLDEAIAAHRESVRLQPESAQAHTNLGVALQAKGKSDEAITAHRKATRLQPDSFGAHGNLGIALAAAGKPEEAIAAFRESIRLRPDNATAQRNLGIALAEFGDALSCQGKHDEAIAAYRETIRIVPRHVSALNRLAWLYANCPDRKLRNAKQAVVLATRAASLAPHWAFLNTLGVAHFRAGNHWNAVAALEKSMSLREGGDSYDWFWLAMAFWELDRKEMARQWYARAVTWMDKNKPEDKELRRFREEARKLLQIDG